MQVEIGTDDFLIDARLHAEVPRLDPTTVHSLLKTPEITFICEREIGEHKGEYRLGAAAGRV